MKKYFLYFLFLIIVIPTQVSAASITVSCDKTEINVGEEVNCNLSSNDLENITYNKLTTDITAEGSSSLTFTASDGFSGNITDNKLVVNSNSLVGNSVIGTLKVKYNNGDGTNYKLKLSNIKFYNGEEEVSNASDIETSINIKKTEIAPSLESLSVSDCDSCKMSPSFKKNVTFYMVSTKSDQIRINAKASSGSTVSGAGLKRLTKDSETFEIKVTSTTGNSIVYKIKVTKEPKADATLKALSIDKGKLTPSFSSDFTSYSATVDSDKVVINATVNNSKATVKGTGEKTLEYGKNTFTIVVTAEDGTTKSYLINITRPDTRNANAYLKELTINGEDINFEKDIIDYNYTIKEDITKLEIEAIPELENSKVEITGNEDFKLGENIVTIKVTAEDGSSKIYTITVLKEESNDEVSGPYLTELQIKGYSIKFNKETFEYTITIKDENKLDITALSEDNEVEIIGNEQLQDGSIIKIIVTDENGENNIYKIKINKEEMKAIEEKDGDINYIPIIMVSLLGILLVIDTMLLIKKVKEKDN